MTCIKSQERYFFFSLHPEPKARLFANFFFFFRIHLSLRGLLALFCDIFSSSLSCHDPRLCVLNPVWPLKLMWQVQATAQDSTTPWNAHSFFCFWFLRCLFTLFQLSHAFLKILKKYFTPHFQMFCNREDFHNIYHVILSKIQIYLCNPTRYILVKVEIQFHLHPLPALNNPCQKHFQHQYILNSLCPIYSVIQLAQFLLLCRLQAFSAQVILYYAIFKFMAFFQFL